jgi:phosphoribosyl 1,2-cyclic phosphate phosphodiesterase
MSRGLEFTILGCGSSGGVPRADGAWGACDPGEPKNRRSRCSLLVRQPGKLGPEGWTTVLVDTAPELRLQTAAAGVTRIDAVLFTHDHADQTHGIDDLRAFYLRHRRSTPCYMDEATAARLIPRFAYAFAGEGGYPAICEARALPPLGQPFAIEGPSGAIPAMGFDQDHGAIRSVGFRFADVAYSSDVVGLPPSAFEALAGVDTWIVDALRDSPHPTHAHVDLTLDWIAAVKPRRAILTNLHIDLDYAALRRRLPPGVEPAYDGLRFEAGCADRQVAG